MAVFKGLKTLKNLEYARKYNWEIAFKDPNGIPGPLKKFVEGDNTGFGNTNFKLEDNNTTLYLPATSVSYPHTTVNTKMLNLYGVSVEIPIGQLLGDLIVTFLEIEEGTSETVKSSSNKTLVVKQFFHNWVNVRMFNSGLFNQNQNKDKGGIAYFSEYLLQADIFFYSSTEDSFIKKDSLLVFPKGNIDQSLDYSSEFISYTINFSIIGKDILAS